MSKIPLDVAIHWLLRPLRGNESQLPKESEAIPIHPAFHNSIVPDTIDPDPRRHGRWPTRCIARDHFVAFRD